MDYEYSIGIDNVRRALEIKKVSQNTMRMFESIIQKEEGKKEIYNLSFTISMYKREETIEKVIERFYNQIIGTPLPTLTPTPDSSENPNSSNEVVHKKLDVSQQKELEEILKKFFDKGVLNKGCLVSNRIFGKEKTVELCCKTVCKKIDSLVSTLEKFLTTKIGKEATLLDTSLKNIAPDLDEKYKVDDKDTSIFKYVLQCFVDNGMDTDELLEIKPQIEKLESFFGFKKTVFPSILEKLVKKNVSPPLEWEDGEGVSPPTLGKEVEEDVSPPTLGREVEKNVLVTGGKARSRLKRRTSKNSRKSRGRGHRHRRSSHNKKRHTKRHTKRYRKRK